jgi:hypothetical protein
MSEQLFLLSQLQLFLYDGEKQVEGNKLIILKVHIVPGHVHLEWILLTEKN